MRHKLILIDGITGSGKSSTTQFLSQQLNLNGFEAVWHHEEEENHCKIDKHFSIAAALFDSPA